MMVEKDEWVNNNTEIQLMGEGDGGGEVTVVVDTGGERRSSQHYSDDDR